MFRNQYDSDVSVWSPQGRIYQIEYAMEAVKQGSATVGIKSKTHVVLVALKRAPSELSSHQKKILPIDDHLGISIAGLTADARIFTRYMRNECLNSKYAFSSPMPVSRLVTQCGAKSQIPIQRYGRRPFGVGLLVAGFDDLGSHLYQTCPSGNFYECKAMSIGARSQSARTYLEKHLTVFPDCPLDELIKHAMRALRDTLPSEIELSTKNCSLGIVGKDTVFTIFDDEKIKPYLDAIESDSRGPSIEDQPGGIVTDEGENIPPLSDPQVNIAMDVPDRMDSMDTHE